MTTWDGLARTNQQLQRQLREAVAERDALAVKVADAWDEGWDRAYNGMTQDFGHGPDRTNPYRTEATNA